MRKNRCPFIIFSPNFKEPRITELPEANQLWVVQLAAGFNNVALTRSHRCFDLHDCSSLRSPCSAAESQHFQTRQFASRQPRLRRASRCVVTCFVLLVHLNHPKLVVYRGNQQRETQFITVVLTIATHFHHRSPSSGELQKRVRFLILLETLGDCCYSRKTAGSLAKLVQRPSPALTAGPW